MSFIYLYSNNPNYKPHYGEFLTNTSQIVDYFKSKIKGEEIIAKSRYTKEFENGFLTLEKNKIFGGGIKKFYWHCSTVKFFTLFKIIQKGLLAEKVATLTLTTII